MKGVITGDIIGSTSTPSAQRQSIPDVIMQTAATLSGISQLKCETFRGDSFQILVEKTEQTLAIAILMRAGLKRKTPPENMDLWDSRIAIGIGDIDYESEHVTVSDGEAFRFSGRMFDELGKRNLAVRTRWDDVNDELAVSTALADDIINGWTSNQAEAIWLSLGEGLAQKEIALRLGKTKQNVSKLLASAKEPLISLCLKRFTQIILSEEKKQWISQYC